MSESAPRSEADAKGLPPFYGVSPSNGLHVLKNFWVQKTYLREQSTALADQLADSIKQTQVLTRTQGFMLDREPNPNIHESQHERLLEQALWLKWRGVDAVPVPGCWDRLLTYQVPLFANADKTGGLGFIDLIGIDADGTLVVVELKKPDAKDTPLRIVIEAAAYAVSLRQNWPVFRPELQVHLNRLGLPELASRLPATLSTVRLVGLAPATFWQDWLPFSPRGLTTTAEAWVAFRRLLAELRKENLPTEFATIDGSYDRPESLDVRNLVGFPLG